MKATLSFYKGKGRLFDKLIRWRTESKYSHVELIIDGVCYSSSTWDGGVRSKVIFDASNPVVRHTFSADSNWDFIEVSGSKNHAMAVFNAAHGMGYDYIGIAFAQALKLGWHSQNRYFCSELCAEMLGLARPESYSPKDLYRHFC